MPVLMIGLICPRRSSCSFAGRREGHRRHRRQRGWWPRNSKTTRIRFETTELLTEEARALTDSPACLHRRRHPEKPEQRPPAHATRRVALLESNITGQIERILGAEKTPRPTTSKPSYILDEVKTSVNMQTFRNDKSQEEDTQAQSFRRITGVGYVLGFILTCSADLRLMVMQQSVIEEKNNRVLSVMVRRCALRPDDGKTRRGLGGYRTGAALGRADRRRRALRCSHLMPRRRDGERPGHAVQACPTRLRCPA